VQEAGAGRVEQAAVAVAALPGVAAAGEGTTVAEGVMA
jgi:hypothetical protein